MVRALAAADPQTCGSDEFSELGFHDENSGLEIASRIP
jgi:hypothetical protein